MEPDDSLPLLPAETIFAAPRSFELPDFSDADYDDEPAPMVARAAPSVPQRMTTASAAPPFEPPPGVVAPPTAAAPAPAPNGNARTRAGLGLIALVAGGAAGYLFLGGWKGATGGVLLAAAARNGLRARRLWGSTAPAERSDAATSATLGVLAGATGGYLAYSAYQGDDDEGADREAEA